MGCAKRNWEDQMLRVVTFVVAVVSAALAPAIASAQMPVSNEKLKIVIGHQPLTPTWGGAIVTGAQLSKPTLPNVTTDGSALIGGNRPCNTRLAGNTDFACY